MPNPGSIANIVPPTTDFLLAKMRDMQAQIDELKTARTGNAMTIDGPPGITVKGGGGVTLQDGGGIEVDDGGGINVNDGGIVKLVGGYVVTWAADGVTPIVVFGTITPYKGMQVSRADGSLMLSALIGPGLPGFIGLYDKAGRIVMSDDASSGHGLATPHVGAAILLSNDVTTWPKTTSGSFTEIARGFLEIQNPRIQWFIEHGCDGGTTGEVRLKVNGTQVGTTQTSPAGSITGWQTSDDVPSLVSAIGNIAVVSLEAQITSGAGTLYARGGFVSGNQS